MTTDFSNVYVLIKGEDVVNSIIFEGDSPDFINGLKEQLDVDVIVNCGDLNYVPSIGWKYNKTTGEFIEPLVEYTPPARPEGVVD